MSHASGIAALIKYLLKLKLKTYLLLCGCETAENCHFKKDFINKLFHFRGACTAKQMLFFFYYVLASFPKWRIVPLTFRLYCEESFWLHIHTPSIWRLRRDSHQVIAVFGLWSVNGLSLAAGLRAGSLLSLLFCLAGCWFLVRRVMPHLWRASARPGRGHLINWLKYDRMPTFF